MQHVREAGQGAVQLEHVTNGDNALGGVDALAITIEPTELVVVQPERRGLSKMQAPSEGIESEAGVPSAYPSSLRVVLVAIASAKCFAPSGLSSLPLRLPMRDKARR